MLHPFKKISACIWIVSIDFKSTRSSPLCLVALQEGNEPQRLHLYARNAHYVFRNRKKIDVRQLSRMINRWEINRETAGGIIGEGGKHKPLSPNLAWISTRSDSRGSSKESSSHSPPLLDFQYYWNLQSHSKMPIVFEKEWQNISQTYKIKQREVLFPFTLYFLCHISS